MHNRIGFNRLSRKSSHRKAMLKNMVTSLLKHERITTTHAKAKEVRRMAEKLITRGKVDSVHNRRIAAKTIQEKDVLNKLFVDLGKKYEKRAGGYTRILKLGQRAGDAAEEVILELVEEAVAKKTTKKKKAAPKKAKAPAKEEKKEEKVEEAPVEETAAAEAPAEEAKEEAAEASTDATEAEEK